MQVSSLCCVQVGEAAYAALEADLQHELDNYESLHPGYDEYRFDLDEIKHDPYVLTSILSALHNGVFTLGEVQGDLAMLFEKQYILTQTIPLTSRSMRLSTMIPYQRCRLPLHRKTSFWTSCRTIPSMSSIMTRW